MTEYKIGDTVVCIKDFEQIYSSGKSYTIDSIPFSKNYAYISEGIHQFGRIPFLVEELEAGIDPVGFLMEDYFIPFWKWRETKIGLITE